MNVEKATRWLLIIGLAISGFALVFSSVSLAHYADEKVVLGGMGVLCLVTALMVYDKSR